MGIEDFIGKLDEVFEETDLSTLKGETEFRKLEEWSSMSVLALITFADTEFDKVIDISDINKAKTIKDLYELMTR